MNPNSIDTERRKAWSELKAAVHAYARNQSQLNSTHVINAVAHVRAARRRAGELKRQRVPWSGNEGYELQKPAA